MRGRHLVIRQSEREHHQWERWAAERNLTVSDLVRHAVSHYVHEPPRIVFADGCINRGRHIAGVTCPGCGGNTRRSA
jgi:hypothetical protein